jgi:hypothetical protein
VALPITGHLRNIVEINKQREFTCFKPGALPKEGTRSEGNCAIYMQCYLNDINSIAPFYM